MRGPAGRTPGGIMAFRFGGTRLVNERGELGAAKHARATGGIDGKRGTPKGGDLDEGPN